MNDAQIAQAIAADLARIGIKVKVNAIPKNTFFPMMDRPRAPSPHGLGMQPAGRLRFMTANAHSVDDARGLAA